MPGNRKAPFIFKLIGKTVINYQALINKSMYLVLKESLLHATKQRDVCFFISFITCHPGVVMSPHLKSENLGEMTIVLEHQFEDLAVSEEGFSVTLFFGGKPEHMVIPYVAITSYIDRNANFALSFDVEESIDSYIQESNDKELENESEAHSNVIFLDKFRK